MKTIEMDAPATTRVERQGTKYPLKIAFADYDRTRPLIDGRVGAEGLDLAIDTRWIGDFCRTPVYEEYDAAEMSFSWYITARSNGEPVIALPIFLLRMPVLAYVYVRSDSPFREPRDLIGKRIGSRGYRQTVNLWLRGIFKEHYSLSPEQVTWVLAEEQEGAGYTIPDTIRREIHKGCSTIENLKSGIVDAMFCTSVPKEFKEGQPWLRRLFPETQTETQALARRTGITPLTHVLAMNKRLADREPWIAENLYRAFAEAQTHADAMCSGDPKCLSAFDSVFIVEQQRAAYGSHPYVHGVGPNRVNIDAFARYAHDQGYTTRRMAVEDLFVPATLNL